MPARWGCVGIWGLPLKGGPTGPYQEGVPRHQKKKKREMTLTSAIFEGVN